MAKGPITIHILGQGTRNLVHYPLQDTLTAIDDIQRQKYNKVLIWLNIYTYFRGVSDDGDEELLRNDNYKRLFPWYRTSKTLTSIETRLWRARKELNQLLRLNNTLVGVVQPPATSKLPPNLTPAQQQQVQVQEQVYDAQVAASQVAALSNIPPSTQTVDVPEFSQSELNNKLLVQNHSAIHLQSSGHSSTWVEPPLAYDNLLMSEETTNQSGQPRFTTDSRSRKALYRARVNANARKRLSSKFLPLQNERRYGNAAERDSDSHTKSGTDITDTNQRSPTSSTLTLPQRPKTPLQSSVKPLNTQEDNEIED